jgi:hypothetical protein
MKKESERAASSSRGRRRTFGSKFIALRASLSTANINHPRKFAVCFHSLREAGSAPLKNKSASEEQAKFLFTQRKAY